MLLCYQHLSTLLKPSLFLSRYVFQSRSPPSISLQETLKKCFSSHICPLQLLEKNQSSALFPKNHISALKFMLGMKACAVGPLGSHTHGSSQRVPLMGLYEAFSLLGTSKHPYPPSLGAPFRILSLRNPSSLLPCS